MKWLKQHCRGVCRIGAVLFLCIGSFCGYWWFYRLAPSRRTLDPKWHATHSQREYWSEVQKGIHRGEWSHNDGFTVGMYGDKSCAEWIMTHITPGESMDCFGSPCHSATAMQYITNQDAGEDADSWLAWWKTNKSKSQLEWMADGFRKRGFNVDVPPKVEQVPILLAILGDVHTNVLTAISKEMKYNAFRCLRDSGFDAVAFALSNRTMSAEVQLGLLDYAKDERRWPSACGVGILPFAKTDKGWEGRLIPLLLTPTVRITANALVFGSMLFGVTLLVLSVRQSAKRTL